jgi:hypothetical protein
MKISTYPVFREGCVKGKNSKVKDCSLRDLALEKIVNFEIEIIV